MQCMIGVMINDSAAKGIAHSLIASYWLASNPLLKMTMEKKRQR